MATPSGTISFADLRTEIGSTGSISLNDGAVRDLIGRLYQIDMSTARSKTYNFSFAINSGPDSGGSITALASAAGWPGTGNLTATVASGVVVNTLEIDQNLWGNVSLINNGTIMGRGGAGGIGGGGVHNVATFHMSVTPGRNGGSGMVGLWARYAPSTNRTQRNYYVTNNGLIAGGGGGGGGGSPQNWGYSTDSDAYGGGGGGGGRGLPGGFGGGLASVTVINGPPSSVAIPGEPGTDGSTSSAGVGVEMQRPSRFGTNRAGRGGNGGDLGAGGENGRPGSIASVFNFIGYGGVGGNAVTGNVYINWLAFGTRTGAIV